MMLSTDVGVTLRCPGRLSPDMRLMPALTPSTISSRSYSARGSSMLNVRRPVEVAGSMPRCLTSRF
jgi:hypothetical protein